MFSRLRILSIFQAAPAPVIIGGSDAKDGEFPHQVSLKRATGSHYCGGSVIGPQYVSENNLYFLLLTSYVNFLTQVSPFPYENFRKLFFVENLKIRLYKLTAAPTLTIT